MKKQEIERHDACRLLNTILEYALDEMCSSAQPPPRWAKEVTNMFKVAGVEVNEEDQQIIVIV